MHACGAGVRPITGETQPDSAAFTMPLTIAWMAGTSPRMTGETFF